MYSIATTSHWAQSHSSSLVKDSLFESFTWSDAVIWDDSKVFLDSAGAQVFTRRLI